ncbi:MAG TPA: ABC transporter substrate-binding protein [Microvirga sp.]|jgi:putative ABC transport system substrate-binding protein|nr:ABC transporter substrate-binding protein [Microvirga sp.]
MKRREVIGLLGSLPLVLPVSGRAQASVPVIGFLSIRSPSESAPVLAAFHQGLSATGFREGQNLVIEYRWAEGAYERLPALAAELVARGVALIVAAGGDRPVFAARNASPTTPIIFTGSDDPVRFGLVRSLAKPGGNITGTSLFTSELEGKRFLLLRELVPNARLIAMLVNPHNPTAESDVRAVQEVASAVGQPFHAVEAGNEQAIDAAFEAFAQQRPDALLVAHDPFFNSRRHQITALAARYAIPAIYEFREFVLAGGLMSYGSRLEENYRRAGIYAGSILKGARPADLPVQQPTQLELTINLKAAKALDLEVPPALLIQADEVIE